MLSCLAELVWPCHSGAALVGRMIKTSSVERSTGRPWKGRDLGSGKKILQSNWRLTCKGQEWDLAAIMAESVTPGNPIENLN